MPNTTPELDPNGDMAPEYDFSRGVRGKHAGAYQQGYTIIVHKADGTTETRDFALPAGAVVLDPDVSRYFHDSESVNRVLRGLIDLLPQHANP